MNILYITYDGLTDFIGQAQVLPYLLGCAKAGHQLTVISFEKPDRKQLIGEHVAELCRDAGISWQPQKFRSHPPYLAKLIDQLAMRRAARAASATGHFDLLHCRSYQAALVGLETKRRTGISLLFDMRGFLPDSRREGGRWTDDSLVGRMLYTRWKGHEDRLIRNANHIVSLTKAARSEIERWPSYQGVPISVVPCCADFDHFSVADEGQRTQVRDRLGISPEAPVLGYLGSRGTIYMIAEHLRLFAAIRKRDPAAKAVFIGDPDPSDIFAAANELQIALTDGDIRVIQAERTDVPYWLGAFDAGTCFYSPSYSSLHVSPTKLAEYLACGIPAIANRAVGDAEAIIHALQAGHLLAEFTDDEIDAAADAFFELRPIDRIALRNRARPSLDLPTAVSAYLRIYDDPHTAVSITSW